MFFTSCIVRTRDFDLKISGKKCGLYSKIYGMVEGPVEEVTYEEVIKAIR